MKEIVCAPKLLYMNTQKNHEFSLQTAIDMTKRFRAHKPSGFAQSESFDKSAIQKLLDTSGCARLRVYYGMKANMETHAILVAVDSAGNDILPSATVASPEGGDDPVIIEDGFRCPPLCPVDSPLNQD